MNKHTLFQSLVTATALLVSSLTAGWAYADSLDGMCVFGDSLSDTGNAFEVLQQVSTPPYDAIPSAPYPKGGPTYTNGRAWVEHFAKSIKHKDAAKPAFSEPESFCNYSFGSARARQRPDEEFDLPGLVDRYLDNVGHEVHPDTLHIVFVGGNDIRDALFAPAEDINIALGILYDAAVSIGENIVKLTNAGARKFLVMNAPNISFAPAVVAQGLQAQGFAAFLSSQFNDFLTAALMSLPQDSEVSTFDLFGFTNVVFTTPPEGIVNSTESCITPGVVEDAVCDKPDQYAFWDGIHPSRVIHEVLAEAVEAAVVPTVIAGKTK